MQKSSQPEPPRRSTTKSLGMLVLGAASVLYIANPGLGVFELLPDVVPGVGNIDEALATMLLLRVLAYFGLNLVGNPRGQGKEDGPIIDIGGPGDDRNQR